MTEIKNQNDLIQFWVLRAGLNPLDRKQVREFYQDVDCAILCYTDLSTLYSLSKWVTPLNSLVPRFLLAMKSDDFTINRLKYADYYRIRDEYQFNYSFYIEKNVDGIPKINQIIFSTYHERRFLDLVKNIAEEIGQTEQIIVQKVRQKRIAKIGNTISNSDYGRTLEFAEENDAPFTILYPRHPLDISGSFQEKYEYGKQHFKNALASSNKKAWELQKALDIFISLEKSNSMNIDNLLAVKYVKYNILTTKITSSDPFSLSVFHLPTKLHNEAALHTVEELLEISRKLEKLLIEFDWLIKKVYLLQDVSAAKKTLQEASLLFNKLSKSMDPITKLKFHKVLLFAHIQFENRYVNYKKYKNDPHGHYRKIREINKELCNQGLVNVVVFDLLDNAEFEFTLTDLKTFSEHLEHSQSNYRGQEFSYLEELKYLFLHGEDPDQDPTLINLGKLLFKSELDPNVSIFQIQMAIDFYFAKEESKIKQVPKGKTVQISFLGNWEDREEKALRILKEAGLNEIKNVIVPTGRRGASGMMIVTTVAPVPQTLSKMRHIIVEAEVASKSGTAYIGSSYKDYNEIKKQIHKRQQQKEKEQLFSMVDEMIVWLKKRRGRLTNANVKRFIAEKGFHNVSASDRREFDQKVWEKLSVKRR